MARFVGHVARSRSAVAATLLASLILAACQDYPIGPSMEKIAPTMERGATNVSGLHAGENAFLCLVTRPAPEARFGLESRRVRIYFPRAEAAPSGRTFRYSYVQADAKQWYGSADCTIPRTEAAVRRMDRIFDAYGAGVVRTAKGSGSGGAQIMGCVADGMCTIEGITVTAPPTEREKQVECAPDDPSCSGTGGTRWSGSGGEWGGSGDYGGWTSGGDTDDDGDHADEGPIAFAVCVAAALGVDGWLAIGGTALAAYELWSARVDVQNAYDAYQGYQNTPSGSWDPNTSDLYRVLWQNAKSSEDSLWRGLAASGIVSAAMIGKAIIKCIPATAAPV